MAYLIKYFSINLLLILLSAMPIIAQQKESPITLVIHGGAGNITRENISPAEEKQYREILKKALDVGYKILKDGGTSVEAVSQVLVLLEDSPLFNAGRGSVFTSEGRNEMDASIMDGESLNAGAVGGITIVKNPVLAAKMVMEKSPHVFLTGKGAEEFARQQGLEIVDPSWFSTPKRKKALDNIKILENQQKGMNQSGENQDHKYGTVGAVALDKNGNLAAATSTGGMTNKKFGRIGDSPIIGAGTYANNNTCAVSCTGHGEYFIRLAIAHDVSALMEYKNLTVQQAGEEVINKLTASGGTGGVIIVDKYGNIAMPFNTEGMFRGYIIEDGTKKIHLYKGAD